MDLLALQDLLQTSKSNKSSTFINDIANENSNKDVITPASFGSPKKCTKSHTSSKISSASKDNNCIWSPDEIPSINPSYHQHSIYNSGKYKPKWNKNASEVQRNIDKRLEPAYEIYYKQGVGTEDIFLGISGKSPASFDCTHIGVKVHLPGCQMNDLDLDVKEQSILIESDN